MRPCKSRAGFTMLEMAIAGTILLLIVGALTTALDGGLFPSTGSQGRSQAGKLVFHFSHQTADEGSVRVLTFV